MHTADAPPAARHSPDAVTLASLATLVAPHEQDALRERLVATTTALRERFRTTIEAADAARLARVPAGGGWSALQVLEHLVVSHDDYARVVTPIVTKPLAVVPARGALDASPARRWKPSLFGRLLAKSLVSTRAMPAPKSWRVAALSPRPDVAAAFDQRLVDLAGWMERTRHLDWRRTRTRSPVSALVRLNLGDAFVLLTVHAARHLGQVERALAERRAEGRGTGR